MRLVTILVSMICPPWYVFAIGVPVVILLLSLYRFGRWTRNMSRVLTRDIDRTRWWRRLFCPWRHTRPLEAGCWERACVWFDDDYVVCRTGVPENDDGEDDEERQLDERPASWKICTCTSGASIVSVHIQQDVTVASSRRVQYCVELLTALLTAFAGNVPTAAILAAHATRAQYINIPAARAPTVINSTLFIAQVCFANPGLMDKFLLIQARECLTYPFRLSLGPAALRSGL
jgi:hypothetical protein